MVVKRIADSISRAALYARVSTEEQAMHGVSLDAQKERLQRYAEENGLTVAGIYVDEGISARKRYTKRPAFVKMLDDVKNSRIDVVLFIKLDRWFRNIADYYEVQAILDRYGVQWIATDEDYDTTTANGRLALNIKLAIAQDESDRTSERIKFVFQNMVKEGRVISGSTPLGYRIENKRVVIDEKTAPAARAAFNKMADCRSIRETTRFLLDEYRVTLDVQSVKKLLTNKLYIGQAHGMKNWCEPLVDEQLFNLVGQIIVIGADSYAPRRNNRVYYFSGLIFCAECERRLAGRPQGPKGADGKYRLERQYYICKNAEMHRCTMNRHINQAKLEEWLLRKLEAISEEYALEITEKPSAELQKALEPSKILSKFEKLKDLYLNDLIPKELYEREYSSLKKQLDEAKASTAADTAEASVYTDFKELYAKLSDASKKAFWVRLIKKITVYPDKTLSVEFNEL